MFAKSIVALAPFVALATAQSNVAATFTHYGSGDQNGSVNCKNPPASQALACGPTANQVSGYTAAISQNDYGAGPGDGAGPGCGQCWSITINKDSSGQPVPEKTIEVAINNLCPAQGNEEWCSIPAGGTNQHGGTVHFDLCSDTGAQGAFFPSTTGAGEGTATKVTCGSTTGGNGTAPGGSAPSAQPTTLSTSTYPPATPAGGSGSYTPPSAPGNGAGSPGAGSPGAGAPGSNGGSYPPSSPAGGAGASPVAPGGAAGTPAGGRHHRGGNHGHFPGFPYGPSKGGQSPPGANAPGASGPTEGEGDDLDCDS